VSVYPAEVDKSIYNLHSSLKPVEIACWHSHFEVFRKIADGDDDVAIIFEDDIDMEWDLERRLRYIWPFLPDGWDQVMIGHCLSDEAEKNRKVTGTTYLYRASQPMCTHAYALSKKSAAHFVRLMRSPLFAYSRPIDHAFNWLVSTKQIEAFSVHPPPVIQSAVTHSDISGMGPGEYYLMDSALERASMWEGMIHSQGVTPG